MLYLGINDFTDFYKIYLGSVTKIYVEMYQPIGQNLDLFLYSPSEQEKANSTKDRDAAEFISYTTDSIGYWFIEVRRNGGRGFYNFTVYSSGGGGCPTLFVWDGTSYVEEGVLNIHAESDVTVQHEIENALALEDGVYKLQLRELDNFTSHIDQVKLYAVDGEGKWHLCPLIYAYHNEIGKVTWKLLFDDGNRVDLKPTEIIDLKFASSIPYGETAYLIFEINGYNMKWPGDYP